MSRMNKPSVSSKRTSNPVSTSVQSKKSEIDQRLLELLKKETEQSKSHSSHHRRHSHHHHR